MKHVKTFESFKTQYYGASYWPRYKEIEIGDYSHPPDETKLMVQSVNDIIKDRLVELDDKNLNINISYTAANQIIIDITNPPRDDPSANIAHGHFTAVVTPAFIMNRAKQALFGLAGNDGRAGLAASKHGGFGAEIEPAFLTARPMTHGATS